MQRLTAFVGALAVLAAATSTGAATEGGPELKLGLRALGKAVRGFLGSQPEDLKLGDGVHIVSTRSENDARAATDDGSVLGAVQNYLKDHEVRIRLPELMPGEGFGRAFKEAMAGLSQEQGSPRGKGGGGGGGGKGGGGGGIIILGLMMGKMLAALGLGGVGLLAWKALMVSALALLLSTIIGLKKLVHSDHDDHGGHTVIHASHGHHDYRRKREAADMAYRAWADYMPS